jgi:hypothetical protein
MKKAIFFIDLRTQKTCSNCRSCENGKCINLKHILDASNFNSNFTENSASLPDTKTCQHWAIERRVNNV